MKRIIAFILAAGLQGPAVVEYPLPRAGAFPHDPAVGTDGTVWYTDQRNRYIGRLDPATGKVTDFPTPTPASGPHGIIVAPDGAVWYTGSAKGLIGRLEPASGDIKEYPMPAAVRDPHAGSHRAQHDGRLDPAPPVAGPQRDAATGSDRLERRALAGARDSRRASGPARPVDSRWRSVSPPAERWAAGIRSRRPWPDMARWPARRRPSPYPRSAAG